jgi:hypothetical protein
MFDEESVGCVAFLDDVVDFLMRRECVVHGEDYTGNFFADAKMEKLEKFLEILFFRKNGKNFKT